MMKMIVLAKGSFHEGIDKSESINMFYPCWKLNNLFLFIIFFCNFHFFSVAS